MEGMRVEGRALEEGSRGESRALDEGVRGLGTGCEVEN